MGRDMALTAQIDPTWHSVVLTAARPVDAMLRALAEAFAEDRESVLVALGRLAEVVDEGGPAWDATALDVAIDLGLPEPEERLDEESAVRLADELTTAAALTYTARMRAAQPPQVVRFPRQERGAA